MIVDSFFDTNVLIYAALGRRDTPSKHSRAVDLLSEANFGISTQVLQEFYVNATKKSSKPLLPVEALEWVERLAERPCIEITPDMVRDAIATSVRWQINYWDAALLVAAENLGAGILYTEDLNNGQLYGSVRVINPFLQS
jgi:predicted nucleic acid-binding protein